MLPKERNFCCFFGVIMAIVTYRGVKYDTALRSQRPTEKFLVEETYRGIPHQETVEVKK